MIMAYQFIRCSLLTRVGVMVVCLAISSVGSEVLAGGCTTCGGGSSALASLGARLTAGLSNGISGISSGVSGVGHKCDHNGCAGATAASFTCSHGNCGLAPISLPQITPEVSVRDPKFCNLPVPAYPAPYATPRPTVPTQLTYGPFMPHNSLPNYRGTYLIPQANGGPGGTQVHWRSQTGLNALKRVHKAFEWAR